MHTRGTRANYAVNKGPEVRLPVLQCEQFILTTTKATVPVSDGSIVKTERTGGRIACARTGTARTCVNGQQTNDDEHEGP
jgi:hypothetical protein